MDQHAKVKINSLRVESHQKGFRIFTGGVPPVINPG